MQYLDKGVFVIFMSMFFVGMILAGGLGFFGRACSAAGAEATVIIPSWLAIQAFPAILALSDTSFEFSEVLACILLWIIGGLAAITLTYAKIRPNLLR